MKVKLTLFLAFLLSGAGALNVSAYDKQLENAITSMGYRITSKIESAAADWELRDFNMRSKQIYNIKSKKKIPGERNIYYRFTVRIEEFANVEDAGKRAAQVQSTPPGPDSKMIAPEFDLRIGFQMGERVVVVSTDVYTFVVDKSLSKFLERLSKSLARTNNCGGLTAKCYPIENQG